MFSRIGLMSADWRITPGVSDYEKKHDRCVLFRPTVFGLSEIRPIRTPPNPRP